MDPTSTARAVSSSRGRSRDRERRRGRDAQHEQPLGTERHVAHHGGRVHSAITSVREARGMSRYPVVSEMGR